MTADELLLTERRDDSVILELPRDTCLLVIILWSCEGPALCIVIVGGGELAILYTSSETRVLEIAGFRAEIELANRLDGFLEVSWDDTRSSVILA